MRFFNRNIQSTLLGAMMLVAPAVAGLSSCSGVVYDDLAPCPEGLQLRFIYDYNMEFANAFPSQVHCLTLFVYDEEGNYLKTITETSRERLSDENYRMTIDLPEGKYSLVAYGGMACDESSFHFVQTPTENSKLTDLSVSLNSSIMNRPVGTELHKLFYGRIETEVKKETMDYEEYTLPMMRDTNNLRIVLQQLDGESVDDRDFDYEVIDDNTLMAWNNDVTPVSPFSYLPWTQGQVSLGMNSFTGNEIKAAFAEFSLGRLIDPYAGQNGTKVGDNVTTPFNPTLHITRHSDGSDVINIPLINYLAMLKSESFHKMSTQEYLDRENQWSMIFFLDRHWKWVYVQIEVNAWTVRVNNPEL